MPFLRRLPPCSRDDEVAVEGEFPTCATERRPRVLGEAVTAPAEPKRTSSAAHARFGVFLTPDPVTSAAVTSATGFIRAQYGLVSAAAFPPHATLAGSLPIDNEQRLHDVLEEVLRTQSAFRVSNDGVRILGDIVIYDINNSDEKPNQRLRALALAINDAVRPLLQPTTGLAADTHDGSRFHAHLSLASHELYERPDLREEIAAFAAALPVTYPPAFTADTITLYRFEHPTWEGPWWTTMTWTHRKTWHLTSAA